MRDKATIASYEASGPLEAGRFVKLNGSGALVYCGAGDDGLGVLDEDATRVGQTVGVVVDGPAKVQVAAALGAGAKLASDANGRGVAAAADDFVLGALVVASRAPVSGTYDRPQVLVPPVKTALPA